MAKLTANQYAQALFEAVSETSPKDHDTVMDRFVRILAQNGDLPKHPEIEAAYRRLELKAKGMKEAEATFAREHNMALLDELNQLVEGKAEFKTKIDDGIVGGVILRVDDTLIDASVRGELDRLSKHLTS